MDNTVTNIIIVGVGGQGIILASDILSEAALLVGYDVRKSELHGMAQRGGNVSSHVRFGDEVKSPLIERGDADYMLAFEQVEGLRSCDFLKRGVTIIFNNRKIIPTTVSMGMGDYPEGAGALLGELGFNVLSIEDQDLATRAGTAKAENVILLGALASFLAIDRDIWLEVIGNRVPKKFLDVNLEAFRLGYEALGVPEA